MNDYLELQKYLLWDEQREVSRKLEKFLRDSGCFDKLVKKASKDEGMVQHAEISWLPQIGSVIHCICTDRLNNEEVDVPITNNEELEIVTKYMKLMKVVDILRSKKDEVNDDIVKCRSIEKGNR